MRVLVTPDYAALSRRAADAAAGAVRRKPNLNLGLPTGNTPAGMYAELVRRAREEGLDLSQIQTFNLDEYLGLSIAHPGSYHTYMRRHFFDHVQVPSQNIHIPDGSPGVDADDECVRYELAILKAGGIDFLILGIGTTGHIGFNEPGSSFESRTRVVELASETIANARAQFENRIEVPRRAITMGVATILDARQILLLASGKDKSTVMARALSGPVSESMPASALQLHADLTVILDEAAAADFFGAAPA
jgi:glucosamine-6-phosphate deaminase